MKVCAFVLVAPFSIPTVSLDAPASLCRDYLASAPGLVTAACLALRPPLLRHPSLPSPTRDPSVLRGGERTQSCSLMQPGPPNSVQEARSHVAQGSPPEAPPSRASFRCILLGVGQPPQRLPRPRCHSCRSLACGRAGLGDQPRFRDSGLVGLGAQGRGRWGLGCGQTALRKGPSAWWLNPEMLPPVGGGQCLGQQSPLCLPSGLQRPPFLHRTPSLASPLSVLPFLGTRQGGHGSSSILVWEPRLFKFKALPLRADHQPHLESFLHGAGRAGPQRGDLSGLLGVPLTTPLACTAPGSLADKRVSYLGCLLVGASLLGLPHPQPCSGALGAGWRVPSPAGAWSAGTSCAGDQLGPLLGSAGCPYLSWPLPRVPWPCGTQSESSSLAVFLQKASAGVWGR